MRISRRTIFFVFLLVCSQWSAGQTFPSKPVRIVVPFPPGGADVTFRLIQKGMSEDLGQPVIIENRPGANGVIGAEFVARSAPDGYILLGSTSSNLVVGPFVSNDVPFDTLKDFTAITLLFATPNTILVNPSLPIKTLSELVEYAKRNPGKLSYGSSGVGSGQHLDGETLKRTAGISMVHIPYKGFGPMVQAMLSGELDIALMTTQVAAPILSAGKARLVAIYAGEAPVGFPTAPEVSEVVREFYSRITFIGLLGPSKLPAAIVSRLNSAAVKTVKSSDVRRVLEQSGQVYGNSPKEFAELLKVSIESTQKAVSAAKAAGVNFVE